jgi:hypothetical protein
MKNNLSLFKKKILLSFKIENYVYSIQYYFTYLIAHFYE